MQITQHKLMQEAGQMKMQTFCKFDTNCKLAHMTSKDQLMSPHGQRLCIVVLYIIDSLLTRRL